MITVISGTNRAGSNTLKVAQKYYDYLVEKGVEVQLFDLTTLPLDFIHPNMYAERSESLVELQNKYLAPAEKLVIVMPEYNGSFPGIFKLLIDACDIKEAFYGKKASLTGVSSGRAGNLRGLDTLTNMLNYIKVDVLQQKLPISGIGGLLDEDGSFNHEDTLKVMHGQMEAFLKF